MKFKGDFFLLAAMAALTFMPCGHSAAVGLSDLLSPDDVMLRKPASSQNQDAAAKARAEEQARKEKEAAEAAAAKARAEEQARKEKEAAEAAAAKARAEEQARKEKEAAEAAAAKARAEEQARKEKEAAEAAQKKAERKARKKKLQAQTVLDDDASKDSKKKQAGREAVITAERTDYDRKEGVILFDRNVYVDDEQYQLHADRLFLFLDGTNDLKRLVAIGHVAITNEEKNAACSRAVYTKSSSKIVMYGADNEPASLYQGGKRGSTVKGERITFWLNSEQVEIEKPVVTVPGGSFKGGDAKGLFKNIKQ